MDAQRLSPSLDIPAYRVISNDEYAAREADKTRIAASKQMIDCGFPALHLSRVGKETDGVRSMWLKARHAARSALNHPSAIIVLLGNRGTGKTQLVVSLIHDMLQTSCQGLSVRYVRALEFFMVVKDAYSAASSERVAFGTFTTPHILALDEAHVRNGTAWEGASLTYMIDSRYASMRRTLLISNEQEDAFAASIGDSVMDRISETGAIITCSWESFRTGSGGHDQ